MSALSVQLAGDHTEFFPCEEVVATVSWRLDQPAKVIEVNLLWYTRGKGTVDAAIVDTARFEMPRLVDRQSLRLKLPESPYSFSGKLVSLVWAVEVVVDLGKESTRLDITMSPGGREIDLTGQPAEAPQVGS